MSGWYLDGKEQLLARTIPQEAGLFVVGVNDDYAYSPSHALFTAFSADIILPEQELTTTTFVNGVLKADNPLWVNAGQGIVDKSLTLEGVIIYFQLDDVGTLLCFVDSASAGLPQNLIGVNVTAKWDSRGICRL